MKLLRLIKTVTAALKFRRETLLRKISAKNCCGKLLRKTSAENYCGKLLRKTSAEYKIHAPDNIQLNKADIEISASGKISAPAKSPRL
jgi:hypothetical protein